MLFTHTMRATPFSLGGVFEFRVEADEMVGPRTRVTQDDLATLLANLAVVLVVGLD